MIKRSAIGAMALSAVAFVGLALNENYSGTAYMPTKNDVPTYGLGSTTRPDGKPVEMGDTITVTAAIAKALVDVQKFEGALKQCVTVPLSQNEYDAYVDLAYNIGSSAFCGSTLVKKLNAGDYEGACEEIRRWNKQAGKVLPGLTKRREAEYRQCTGAV